MSVQFSDRTKNGLEFALIAGFLLIVALGVSRRTDYNAAFAWLMPSQSAHVLVPKGYEGPVLIAWAIPTGEIAEKENDTPIYRLHEDGVLLLQDEPSQRSGLSFWYEMADGQRVSIPHSTCFDTAQDQGVVVCTGMMVQIWNRRTFHPNTYFYVIRLKDKAKFMGVGSTIVDDLISRYADRLTIQDQH